MTAFSDYLENKVLVDYLSTATAYAAVRTVDVGDDAAGSGTATSRVSCAMTVTGSTAANTSAVQFTAAPSGTFAYVELWDASTGGHLLFHGALGASKSSDGTDNLSFGAGQLTVTLS